MLAECIETVDQADDARRLGVDLGQGWFFGRPVRPDQGPPLSESRTWGAEAVDPRRPDAAIAVDRGTTAALPST